MKTNTILVLTVIFLCLFIAYQSSTFVLEDDDQVVVTQFGRVLGEAKTVPGQYFRIPFLHQVHYFDKKFYASRNTQQIPTKDKKFIALQSRATWRISDPVGFYKRLNSHHLANEFVLDHTGAAERDIITSHTLTDIVGGGDNVKSLNKVGCKRAIERKILGTANPSLAIAGLKLNNIELKLTYPIEMKKP